MEQHPSVLQDLHTYMLRVRSVTEELEEGPRRLKRLQSRVAATEKTLAEFLTSIKTTKVGIHEREVSMKANNEKIKKHKKDLNGITSKKEFDALNVEIASLEKRNSDLEDEALHMMSVVEEKTAKIPEFEQSVARAKEEYAQTEAEHQKQLPSWQTRLSEAKQLVADRMKQLPEDWIKAIVRLETTEGPDALASLTGRACSACYTDVTAQQIAVITSGMIQSCKNCGKFLYLPVGPT